MCMLECVRARLHMCRDRCACACACACACVCVCVCSRARVGMCVCVNVYGVRVLARARACTNETILVADNYDMKISIVCQCYDCVGRLRQHNKDIDE